MDLFAAGTAGSVLGLRILTTFDRINVHQHVRARSVGQARMTGPKSELDVFWCSWDGRSEEPLAMSPSSTVTRSTIAGR